jgi:RNA polymerase sigma-70 factor (ECF subfamily)
VPTPPAANVDVAQLIRDAKTGSRDAIGELLLLYREHLVDQARRNIPGNLTARQGGSDLAQDALVIAFKQFHTFQGDTQEELLAWVRKILDNILQNFIRDHGKCQKRSASREVPLDPHSPRGPAARCVSREPPPDQALIDQERKAVVQLVLAEFSDRDRQIYRARHLEKITFEVLAARFGVPRGEASRVCMTISRALGRKLDALGLMFD